MSRNQRRNDSSDPLAVAKGYKWMAVLLHGLMLILCGAAAIVLAEIATFATGLIVGGALVVAGLGQILQAFQVKPWGGFIWNLSTGIVEVVGGALIYLNPVAGAVAITILIAIVFLVQGFTQIAFALKVRPRNGWGWLLAAGMIALFASAALLSHFPFSGDHEPGVITGISLLLAGCCYVAIALTRRRGASTLRSDH
jgi:uncharacterized membrane protein HdeD (DUF308 family)